MLNYLTESTRPDLAFATHQVARFCANQKLSHEQEVMKIGKYLSKNSKMGMFYNIDCNQGLEYYIDADFAGT